MQISILGCGWLGLPLAKSLLEKGFEINGSTTSDDKIIVLEQAKITAFKINLFEDKIEGKIEDFLKDSEVLIVDIPPKLRGDSNENFVGKIENLVPYIEKSSIKKVVFVSSTGVYADASSLPIVTENDLPIPDTESGKQLLKVESLLLENSDFESIIIRFGGLIGYDRHPIKFLAGRKNIENPDGPVNLIHQKDCIGIVETILQKKENEKVIWNQVYNAVYPFHLTRKEYYTEKALEQSLALPEFSFEKPSVGKTISSFKIEEKLQYKFVKKV